MVFLGFRRVPPRGDIIAILRFPLGFAGAPPRQTSAKPLGLPGDLLGPPCWADLSEIHKFLLGFARVPPLADLSEIVRFPSRVAGVLPGQTSAKP